MTLRLPSTRTKAGDGSDDNDLEHERKNVQAYIKKIRKLVIRLFFYNLFHQKKEKCIY